MARQGTVTWLWVIVSVVSGTLGDVFGAKGMSERGEIEDFRPQGLARVLHYIVTHPLVVLGIACNAVSFGSFLAVLSLAPLSFAVPATSLNYILKTLLAKWYLREHVDWHRWTGVALVAAGIIMISF